MSESNPYPGRMERIEGKVDELVEGFHALATDVALIKQRVELRERSQAKWYDRVITFVLGLVGIAFAAWLGTRVGAP